jgi:glycosyltransferase involved in cell wall biosynthesis
MDCRPPSTEPYRIAFCISDLRVGGAEKCLVELVLRLDQQRWRPEVHCLTPPPPTGQDELVRRLIGAGVEPVFLGMKHRYQVFRAVRQLARNLEAHQPHLLQTFLFHANVVGARAARRAGVPVHVAGVRVADPRSRVRLFVEKRCTRRCARYVCVSQDVAAFSEQTGGLPASKLCVIPNGIDVMQLTGATPIDPTQLGLTGDHRYLLYVGRLDDQKRVDRIVRVMTHLRRRLADHHLVVVGDGPRRAELLRQAKRLDVDDRVHFVGRREDVTSIMTGCTALLLASAWEGMPNVVLEAMAVGKPVISCDSEGVAELLGPGHGEQLIACPANLDEAELIEQFAERVMLIATDQQLASRLGHQNRQRARDHFSVDRMVEAYEGLYLSLLQGPSPANDPKPTQAG